MFILTFHTLGFLKQYYLMKKAENLHSYVKQPICTSFDGYSTIFKKMNPHLPDTSNLQCYLINVCLCIYLLCWRAWFCSLFLRKAKHIFFIVNHEKGFSITYLLSTFLKLFCFQNKNILIKLFSIIITNPQEQDRL